MIKTILTKTYNIDIIIEMQSFNIGQRIVASQYIDPSILDDDAFGQYEDFIGEVWALFANNDFKILNTHYSPDSDTSWYLTMYRNSKNPDKNNIKCIIRVRISDHTLPVREGETLQDAYHRQWVYDNNDIQKNFKFPPTKKYQYWKPKQIIVDNYKTYPDYDEVIAELENRILSW